MTLMRWPLHPRPQTGEALSSWLHRIACEYRLSIEELLVHDLGFAAMPEVELDLEPPHGLVEKLSARTGVAIESIRSMTAKGWMAELTSGTAPCPELFDDYVREFSVLLSPSRRTPKIAVHWRPWIGEPRFSSLIGCRFCVAEDEIPYLRLHWRLPVMACCPRHQIFLKPMRWFNIFKGPGDAKPGTGPARQEDATEHRPSETLLQLDTITLNALACGWATLPTISLRAGIWLRMLRAILDELHTASRTAGGQAQILRAAWREAACFHPAPPRYPFEVMKLEDQGFVLEAAAAAVHLVSTRELPAHGANVRCLGGVTVAEIEAGKKQDKIQKEEKVARPRKRPLSKTFPENRWQKLGESINAVIDEARTSPAAARQFRALLLLGNPDATRIASVDRDLAAAGIFVPPKSNVKQSLTQSV